MIGLNSLSENSETFSVGAPQLELTCLRGTLVASYEFLVISISSPIW